MKIAYLFGFILLFVQALIAQEFAANIHLKKDSLSNKFGYYDNNNKYVIEPIFEEAKEFNNKLARVKIDGKWACINKNGEFVIKPKFENISVPYNERLIVKDSSYYLINLSGEKIFDIKYYYFNNDTINSIIYNSACKDDSLVVKVINMFSECKERNTEFLKIAIGDDLISENLIKYLIDNKKFYLSRNEIFYLKNCE